MFGWLFGKDPQKALQQEYERLMQEAQALQRAGKIPEFAKKDAEAREVYDKLEQLRAESGAS